MRTHTLERLAAWDHALCRHCNRVSDFVFPRVVFIAASQLGNGKFWYALMIALLVRGNVQANRAVIHMVVIGAVCSVLYKLLKHGTSRLRPYAAQPDITLCDLPLDRYSFPSGHAMHATALSLVVLAYYPGLFWFLVPFAVLISLSRVVLGLHYPSDVIAGVAIGTAVATASLRIAF